MEYNSFYPVQTGHPPPPPPPMMAQHHQHGPPPPPPPIPHPGLPHHQLPPHQHPHQLPPHQQHPHPHQPQHPQPGCSPNQMMPSSNMMHLNSSSSTPGPAGIRQVATPGASPLPQPSPNHHLGPPPQSMTPQQQNPGQYNQLPPHMSPLPPPPPHSISPQQPATPHHQVNMNLQPPSRPSTGPSPMHHSPHPNINGPPPPPPGMAPMHNQHGPPHAPPLPPHHQQQQPMNEMVGGPPHPPPQHIMQPGPPPPPPPPPHHHHHPHQPAPPPGMQHHPHNQRSYMGPGPHPDPHFPPPPPPSSHQHHQAHHQGPPPPPPLGPPVHHPGLHSPLPPSHGGYGPPHINSHGAIERGSPFYQNIPQTEFRIIEFNKRLQGRPRPREPPSPLPLKDESYWWEKFISDFFDDDATLTIRTAPDDKQVEYRIGRTLIPRFFRSYFDGGAIDLSIKLHNTREIAHPHMVTLECDQTDIITKNILKHPASSANVVVHTEGLLILDFISNSFDALQIKSWRFYTHQCHEYIDRSMTTSGFPSTYLVEPVTRQGLTTSTISYLKMCKIMEPMQDLMTLHRQTKMAPRSCLKQLLLEKFQHKSVDDVRPQPTKRRKRKAPAATGATGGTNKRNKANANSNANNNNNNSNNLNFNSISNSLMSPNVSGGMPDISLASHEVMVVGEPSMLGAEFNDQNERCIMRIENNQFDPATSNTNASSANNSNSNGASNGNDSGISQNSLQICNNANSQSSTQSNISNHMQPHDDHDAGNSMLMMNQINNGNNDSSSIGANDNDINNSGLSGIGENNGLMVNNSNNSINNAGNSCSNNGQTEQSGLDSGEGNNHIQSNGNNHLVSMNGNVNHITGHMTVPKSEMDLKPQNCTPTMADSEAS